MSRNPYLAASRPTSSFTRSSRTSARRGDLSTGSSLARSRSSATIGSGLGSSYASSYIPTPSTWQRSHSSSRSSQLLATDSPSRATTSHLPSYKASHYTPLNTNDQKTTERKSSQDEPDSLAKSASVQNISRLVRDDSEDNDHLTNYQERKLSQESQKPEIRTNVRQQQSVETNRGEHEKETYRRSFTPTIKNLSRVDSSSRDSADSTADNISGSSSIISSSAPKHLRQGQLLKTRSLELNQQNQQIQPEDGQKPLASSRSVDALLSRLDSMSERELRKSYKDLVIENETLRNEIKGLDEREKQRQQDWIRKERQMQRKISELEEENKQMEQWKQEIQHLKDENSSLIRVVTKLTKKP